MINKIIDLLYSSVVSEGGDGDALWLCKHTPLSNIIPILEKYNTEHNTGWAVRSQDANVISWGSNQEWVTITDSRELYNDQPAWIVLRIDY